MFTTLHRLFIETQRRAARYYDQPLDENEPLLPVLTPVQARQVDGATLLAALATVDEVFRAPVALFYLEEASYLEIADMLGVPLGTVKSRISRGIAQLQARLADPIPKRLSQTL